MNDVMNLPWRLVPGMCETIEDQKSMVMANAANRKTAQLIMEAVNTFGNLGGALERMKALEDACREAHDALKAVMQNEGRFLQPHLAEVVIHAGAFLEQVLDREEAAK